MMGLENDRHSSGMTEKRRVNHGSENTSDQIIGSLGSALAGVTLNQRTGSLGHEGGSEASSAAFASNGDFIGNYSTGNGSNAGDNSSLNWGASSLADGEGAGFPGANSVPGLGGNGAANQSGERPASTALLSGGETTTSGSYRDPERRDEANRLFRMQNLSSEPSTPVRKESLELFLSQSPSKTLGADLLQLNAGGHVLNNTEGQMHRSGSAYSLDELGRIHGSISSKYSASGTTSGMTASSSGDLRDPTIRRKSDSPSCSVTGTSASSRSASPYLSIHEGDNVRKIQAFPGTELPGSASSSRSFAYQATAEVNRMNSMSRGYSADQDYRQINVHEKGSHNYGAAYGQTMEPMSRHGHQPTSGTAPQVLYMAVPTPDGRGQMLQPVQMVQIQGQTASYVLPPASGGTVSAQPSVVVLPTQNEHPGHGAGTTGLNWQGEYSPAGIRESVYGQYGGRSSGDEYLGRQSQDFGVVNQRNSSLLPGDTITSIYSAPQRPPLDELLGNVRRLSRDQVGCRLLQQALDEEGPMAATMVLNEGLSFWGEAMVDPFGNYLFQKILEKITKKERAMLIKTVSARLVNASLNLHGTRSVQKVVEMCAIDEADPSPSGCNGEESSTEILTRALSPAAARLCIDSHGNHVIQRILLKLGHQHATFVFDAVAASVGDVARHRHGCCVIQRCLDSPPSHARSHLVHRIVEKSLDLMQDAYGNYVVQYVLDVCDDSDVHAVCESVVGRVSLLAIQKFSSNVMEKCLERCTDHVKECYLQELSDPERIRELMIDPFGNYVVQRALSVATHAQAVRLVEAMRPHLISSQPGAYGTRGGAAGGMRNTAGGRRIMAKICRRFPNFTLSEVATPEELYSQNKGHLRTHRVSQEIHQSAIPPGLGQQVHYGGDSQQGRLYGDQADLYFEAAPPGYYDHVPSQATYPRM